MSFTIYSTTSQELLVKIENDRVEFIAPAFAEPLKKIPVDACFRMFQNGEKEKLFGHVKEISKDDPLYPTALKMYCQAQLLTHPESYTDKSPT